jgi:small subunit ribosomal protein S16
MLKIKLSRQGRKNLAFYRIVVTEGKSKLSGKTVDILGHYNPQDVDNTLIINKDRYQDWLNKGAQPTDTIRQLVAKNK